MKKLTILATLPLVAALSACGGSETATEAENIEANQTLDEFGFNESDMPADDIDMNAMDDATMPPMNGMGESMPGNEMAPEAPANTMTP